MSRPKATDLRPGRPAAPAGSILRPGHLAPTRAALRPALAAAAAALLAAGCGPGALRSRADRHGPLAVSTLEEVPVCGHRAVVELSEKRPAGVGPAKGHELRGELLAASPAAVTVLGAGGVVTVDARWVERVRVEVRPSHGGRIAAIGSVGALSTVTNGGFLAFTMPAWIIGAISVASSEAGANTGKAGPDHAELPAYARFPQGLPPGWPAPGEAPALCEPPPTAQPEEVRIDPAATPPDPAPAADPAPPDRL